MRRFASCRLCRLAVTPLLAVTAVLAAPAMTEAAGCSGADRSPAKLGRSGAARTTLCLINRERAVNGARALRLDAKLGRAARGHSRDMVAKHFFAHDSRSGASFSARIRRTGWMRSRRSWTVGENLGWGAGPQAGPRAMVAAWMTSAPHRANLLLRRFKLIGIGIADGAPTGGTGATYATDFGG